MQATAPKDAERRFLVPSAEYNVGRFGFVIDPDRHAAYDGPSSFMVGKEGRDSGALHEAGCRAWRRLARPSGSST